MDSALFAIDWGTTSARAYRLDAHGNILEERSAPLGINNIRDSRFSEALDELLGDWRDETCPRIACGMIGSRQGWVEAPYVECPASLDRLAEGIVATQSVPKLLIVPGLITRDARGTPDVMRGEETQLLGAVSSQESVLAVLPGTHSKWAVVEQGLLVDFATFMTGELYSVLLNHSILGRMAEAETTEESPAAFERGLQAGLADGGLTHDLFAARTLALTKELATSDVRPWLSGLLIAREIRDAREWAKARGEWLSVRIIGDDALCRRYLNALSLASIAAELAPPAAAARGLWRIAVQRGFVRTTG